MAAEEVTKESNLARWEAFMKIWIREKRPGYIVVATGTYEVLQLENDVVVFRKKNAEEFYESRSF